MVLLLGLLTWSLAFAAHAADAAPKPDPSLSPADVVKIQLNALANIDKPSRDAGFETVFGFASPGNRSQTGPVKRFAALVREGYPALLNHRSATLADTVIQRDEAVQGVEIIDRVGVMHRRVPAQPPDRTAVPRLLDDRQRDPGAGRDAGSGDLRVCCEIADSSAHPVNPTKRPGGPMNVPSDGGFAVGGSPGH